MWFDKYEVKDFVKAVQEFHDSNLENLDYDRIIDIAARLMEGMVLEDMKQFGFEEAILASFANGLVIGLLVAEKKRKQPKKPLIEH